MARFDRWALLVYRIPAQPTRHRLQVWRRLQKMGALYLQNAVCVLPARPDLVENMEYVSALIEEMGGTCFLFDASPHFPSVQERLEGEFRELANTRMEDIAGRLRTLSDRLESAASPGGLERAEEELKRERIAALRARRLNYCGSERDAEIEATMNAVRQLLDDLGRAPK